MSQTNTNRVEIPDFFKMQGWMIWIGLEKLEILFG
jgi:hypothetical protein